MPAQTEAPPTTWLRLPDLAEMLGCKEGTARHIARQVGFPPAYQWTPGGVLRWERAAVEAWQQTRRIEPRALGVTPATTFVDRRTGPRRKVAAA